MTGKAMACMMAGAVFSMFGCSAEDRASAAEVTAEPGRILIAYYSYSGNTRFAAEQIQKATGGELFEIKPVTPYPADYNACVDQAKKEIAAGVKPELAEKVKEFGKYEVIFVGTPNWWSTMAPPVLAFLSSYEFSGKTVIPFVTHGGFQFRHVSACRICGDSDDFLFLCVQCVHVIIGLRVVDDAEKSEQNSE